MWWFQQMHIPIYYHHNQYTEYFYHHKISSHVTLMSIISSLLLNSAPNNSEQHNHFLTTYISWTSSRVSYRYVFGFVVWLVLLCFWPWDLKFYFLCIFMSIFLCIMKALLVGIFLELSTICFPKNVNSIPFYGHKTIYSPFLELFSHFWLLWIKLLWIWPVYSSLCGITFSFPWDNYLRLKLLLNTNII